MGKALIIAEKPSVARDIAAALGGFTKGDGGVLTSAVALISSAVGHLVELHVPEAETVGMDISRLPILPPQFGLRPTESGRGQFALLAKLMRDPEVDLIVNACDAGREGELIFRLIYEHAGCRKRMARMWLQSMTPDAIREAHRTMKPGKDFDRLADAARSRAEADWLVGINGSRAVTKMVEAQTGQRGSSATGRVQTPTLAIVVDLEEKIRTFVPQDYWEVHAAFGARAGQYVGRWYRPSDEEGEDAGYRVFDKALAEQVVAKCRGAAVESVKDDSKPSSTAAPRLYDLTSLQRDANKRFKFSAKKTLEIAQALYERHKVTTYPRTDSSALPEDYVGSAAEIMRHLAGGSPVAVHAQRVTDQGWIKGDDKRIFDNSKISDHFAIIPTLTRPEGLSADEGRIYEMVLRRFVAAFHPAAQYMATTRTTVVAGEVFRSSGRVLLDAGWKQVYGGDDDKTPKLAPVDAGEIPANRDVQAKGLQTKAPSRLTEATLLSAMENAGKLVDDDELRDAMKERGLGTPATRAATIESLLNDRDGKGRPKEPYMTREGEAQHLVPTGKGIALVQFLRSSGVEALVSPRMTGEWEHKLHLIEAGRLTRPEFMAEIARFTTNLIDVIRGQAAAAVANLPPAKSLQAPCPKCGGEVKAGRFGYDCVASGCGLKLRGDLCSHVITEAEAEQLLSTGSAGPFDDFVSQKTKKKFSAVLKLNAAESKLDFVFDDTPRQARELPTIQGLKCPVCGGGVSDKVRLYGCGDHFALWREVAGKKLTDSQMATLVRDRRLPNVAGLRGSNGKAFSATLVMADNGKVSFKFD
jgi:DNA topoisomerase III